jgi:uncharacterized damage-inducible protein DinB
MSQTQIITKQLDRIFNGPAWYGSPVVEVLAKIQEGNKNETHKGSHSVIEIIGHIITWRKYVIEQLKGNFDYNVSDEMNFQVSKNLDEVIANLKSIQVELIKHIASFPEDRLVEKVSGKPFSYQAMLHGIVHHDLYHLGQISLLIR